MEKNKKTITQLTAILLSIVVTVIALSGFKLWFSEFNSQLMEKQEPNKVGILEIAGIYKINSETFLSIKSNTQNYEIIEELFINDEKCLVYGSNVLTQYDLTKVHFQCQKEMPVNNHITIITNLRSIDETEFYKE